MSPSRLAQMAREREEDRKAGRPQRGLFTGRGTSRGSSRGSSRDDEPSERPRRGARRTMLRAIRQIPTYLRLLIGLISDSRVSMIDRFLVIATIGYILSPLDLLPDVIPFFGQIDDIFLLILSLQRLITNTGMRVLRDHWRGDPDELSDINLAGMLSAAGFFLPVRLRRRLKRMANRSRR